ncbi:hypothetical protein BpHYR1_038792, partial [Brachionus plicatilis]
TGSVKTLISQNIWRKLGCKELKKTIGSFTTANGRPLNVIESYTASLRIGNNEVNLDVFVVVDLQHDCLIGLDYMGKVQETRNKLKEIYSSLGGEEVVKDRKNKASLLSGNSENNHYIPEDLSPTYEDMPFRSNTEDLSPSECCKHTQSFRFKALALRILVSSHFSYSGGAELEEFKADLESEIANFSKLLKKENFKIIPAIESTKEFWINHSKSYPKLFKLAQILLNINSSSSCIERFFSICGFTSQKNRQNINDDLFEMRCIFKANFEILKDLNQLV